MSWRNNPGSSGANTIPLGSRRRFGDDDGPSESYGAGDKRGRSPPPARKEIEYNPDGTKKRRKQNRWGDASENKAAGLMNLPTAISATMTSEQLDAYVTHVRIEEISQKLRINDVVPAAGDRSPSPPPQYDNLGRRVNTREHRYRKKLEDERHKLIEKAMKIIPSYHPPSDYRRPTKTQEKVYVPVNDYPEINFIGLLIGPRGNTLKKMETESGAKIAIRGKGSVKEGKGKSDAAHQSNQDEDLHCLIMADTEDKVDKAKRLIHNVIETAASIPEGQNELKRNQLRELAALNGTLRDDENQACQNCGEIGHRKFDCPQQRNYTASIICRVCGNAGHMARDCPDRPRGNDWRNMPARPPPVNPAEQDFQNFMNELGGNATADSSRQIGYSDAQGGDNRGGAKPWEQGGAGGSAPWEQSRQQSAPWQQRGSPANNSAPWAGRGGQDNYGSTGYGSNNHYQYNQGNAAWGQNGGNYGQAGWQQGYQGYAGAPPPPPPADVPPPPPPSGSVPPPPPPPPA
ncbi:hypothetical protein AMS68_001662 [Peltaster fructicola]|uniref:Branchpoint-bridging protein n=1 Tax=Peltaster fructicola TaxID=286661 RepID=A0A6H0XND1_9PEZI|nr:hypothetical protein AMS68_001662 [Peltaster fructicola]